ncbi:hypothetical protein BaRGS_00009048 [Batillaria attramentaria]|uniref:Uncharacterized protein n=1 Tax=Batillaria attramentaria TaxID=370345 RepID=A0ABD0LL53_9CAEN
MIVRLECAKNLIQIQTAKLHTLHPKNLQAFRDVQPALTNICTGRASGLGNVYHMIVSGVCIGQSCSSTLPRNLRMLNLLQIDQLVVQAAKVQFNLVLNE